jgi:hypothetical protein
MTENGPLADRVYTLDNGRVGFAGRVEAMQENDALRRAYCGLKLRQSGGRTGFGSCATRVGHEEIQRV